MPDEYIKRSDFTKAIEDWFMSDGDSRSLAEAIADMPAADVEEVKHGYWIEYEYDGQMAIKCSVCGDNPGVIYTYRRCPKCGAKMSGPEGGENADK